MPSVGMRRSTRVFGARVLRSGRRLWTESVRGAHGENKFPELLDNSADVGGDAGDCQKDIWHDENNRSTGMIAEHKTKERATGGAMEVERVESNMWGLVYRRKRKRADWTNIGLTEDERYGKKFVRKQWRAKCRPSESFESCGDVGHPVSVSRDLAIVVSGSSYDCGYWIACFLTSVISYLTRARIGMRRLSSFLLSKPIYDAYYSRGLFISQAPITTKNPGFCIISGSRSLMPVFSVDISALPSFLVHMQTNRSLRSAHLDCLLDLHCERDEELMHVVDDVEEVTCQFSSERDHQDCVSEASQVSPRRDLSYSDVAALANDTSERILLTPPHASQISPGSDMSYGNVAASSNDTSVSLGNVAASSNDTSERRSLTHLTAGIPKSALRNLQLRNTRNIQKRRSSLRRKRGRPPSAVRAPKASGTFASDFLRIRNDGSHSSTRLLRSSDKMRSRTNTKELRSALVTENVITSSCSANLLITEADKCFRVEGATISLELSATKQWFLVVTKGGIKQWSLIAQKVMKPPIFNRITHAAMWAGDGVWKLEFVNKQDWLIFKELYKECSDRNLQSPSASVIPVPRVQEVPIPVDMQDVPYVRPDSYITVKDDELSRALVKSRPNYDMDADDEEWLTKLNEEVYAGSELQEIITPESFELVIDALEKGLHYNPEEHLDEQAVYEFCMNLERREVIEAVHKYWVKKRKQKRSALIRIFQLYQPRRSQVIPKSVYRKKRSFKRQASQPGRGKRPLLQAIVAERDALEQQNNVHKLQEAKSAVNRYEGLAVVKRQRAQMLMENADLATYKAMMALKIAEAAAQIAETPEPVPSYFLEWHK